MIAPTFEPMGTLGDGLAAYSKGVDQRQSWMDKAQERQMRDQEMQQRQQQIDQNEILRPVVQAKAAADVLTAHATVASAERAQVLRAQAAAQSHQAETEFLDATKLDNFEDQEHALGQLQAKYAWMENVPDMKPFIDTVNNARAKAVTMVLANKHIEGAQAVADTRAAGALDVATERAKSAQAIADAKTKTDLEKQQRELEHKREVDDLTREIAQLKAKTATDVGAGHDTVRSEASTRHAFAQEADTLERVAQSETDPEAKALLQKKAQAYRAKGEAVAPTAAKPADGGAIPVAPTVVDKNASSVTVGGVSYPIFQDAKGNRAYKINGHFVPLTVQ